MLHAIDCSHQSRLQARSAKVDPYRHPVFASFYDKHQSGIVYSYATGLWIKYTLSPMHPRNRDSVRSWCHDSLHVVSLRLSDRAGALCKLPCQNM